MGRKKKNKKRIERRWEKGRVFVSVALTSVDQSLLKTSGY